MTNAELHKILDDENKQISLKEYQEVLYQLRNDTLDCATREEFELQEQTPKSHWYNGETNAFQIALDLSEHINPNQKAIECLKEVKEKLKIHCEYSGNNGSYIGWYLPESKIDIIIDNKIKELESENGEN